MNKAMANERLRKRFAKWDTNGNGMLERADFEQEGVKIAGAFGKSTDGAEAQAVKDAFNGMFDYLTNQAGTDSLTEEQFVTQAEKMMFEDGEAKFNDVLGPLVKGIVGMCDKNADGQINAEEFASWLTAIGVDSAQASDAFAKVDTNSNGELSVDELLAAVREYHYGDGEVELLG